MRILRALQTAALLLLLTGATAAADDPIAGLENKITKLEAALKEEPAELRPMILRELTTARRALRQSLQERIELLQPMAAASPEEEKAKTERLKTLRSRMEELNRQLSAEISGPASGGVNANDAPTERIARPDENTIRRGGGLGARPDLKTDEAEKETVSAAAAPAMNSSSAPQQFEFGPVSPLRSLKLRVDIVRDWSATDAKNTCSNRPYSHSAGVNRVEVIAYPVWESGTGLSDEFGLLAYKGKNLYIPVAIVRPNPDVKLQIGTNTYTPVPEQTTREVKLVFDRLSLSEASDLVDYLATHKDEIIRMYEKAVARYEVFQVAFDYSLQGGATLSADELYGAIACRVDPTAEAGAMREQLLRAQEGLELQTCVPLDASGQPTRARDTVRVRARPPAERTNLLATATFDAEWTKQVKAMLPALVNSEQNASSSDPTRRTEIEEEAKSGQEPVSATPPLIIDLPCFQLSAAPVLTGQEFHPTTSFHFRYDLYTPDDKLMLKLRGEGETSDTSSYFQRMQISGEGTGLFVKRNHGWQAAAALVGRYSFTRVSNARVDEWKAGGKFEVKAPFVRIFNTGAGANSRPTVSLEGSAAGGTGSTTQTTDFDLGTSFLYTLRPSARFSFDLKVQGGWSNKARFASETSFTYFNIVGRYNFNADWDYVVKYECGRKDPDYRKFCGWQTGFILVTGR